MTETISLDRPLLCPPFTTVGPEFPAAALSAPGRLVPQASGYDESNERFRVEEEQVGRRDKSGQQDRNEGAMDKAKGRVKEAAGALSGDREKKAEGRSDQRRGTAKEKKGHLKDLLK
jgi:uncharacterized protein YjbJ (UPF0337 family)